MGYNTVKELFTGICNSIRTKTGKTGIINHQDIPAEINAIPQIKSCISYKLEDMSLYSQSDVNYELDLNHVFSSQFKNGELGNYIHISGIAYITGYGRYLTTFYINCPFGYTDYYEYDLETIADNQEFFGCSIYYKLDYTTKIPKLLIYTTGGPDLRDIEVYLTLISADESLNKIQSVYPIN